MAVFLMKCFFLNFLSCLNFLVLAGAAKRQLSCPVSDCQAGATSSFLQLPSEPIKYSVEARKVSKVHAKDPGSGRPLYNLEWKPGKFICSDCDTGSCPGCSAVCDLKSCEVEFFQTECWCRKDVDLKLKKPLWKFRQYDGQFLVDDSVKKPFCDPQCKGGVCDSKGLTCKRREEGCRPWWYCNLDPPSKNLDDTVLWGDGSTYTTVANFFQRLLTRGQEGLKTAATKAQAMKKAELEKNDIAEYEFERGSWNCDAASLPPQVQDPETFLWQDRGYVVLNAGSCSATSGKFDTTCFCRQNAENGLENESTCDATCSLGDCSLPGFTCGQQPYEEPVYPVAPPSDPITLEEELKPTVLPQEREEPELSAALAEENA